MSMSWDELERLSCHKDWKLPIPPTCRRCSYNLTGLKEMRCPECGSPFNWKEVSKRAGRIWSLTLRLRHANQDATTGLIMVLSAWFMLGFGYLVGGLMAGLGVVTAWIASLIAMILGSQVLNVRRVPPWARQYIAKPAPKISLGIVTIFLALSLFFASLFVSA